MKEINYIEIIITICIIISILLKLVVIN